MSFMPPISWAMTYEYNHQRGSAAKMWFHMQPLRTAQRASCKSLI